MHSRSLKSVMFVLMCFVLSACATAAQRQAQQIRETVQQAGHELLTCRTAVYNKEEYASITSHLGSPDNMFKPNMAQLADDKVPTKEQRKLLIAYHDDALSCKEAALTKVQNVAPTIAPILADEMTQSDDVMLKLVKGKITWGGAAHETQKIQNDIRAKLTVASQQLDQNLNASHQAELAQRQAFGSALMQWSTEQQLINAANRPVVTTCNDNGSSINCVSR